jgi:phosphatidylserine/phosphatidylglycerophosphate/cardiolipin synthase-like enzyme
VAAATFVTDERKHAAALSTGAGAHAMSRHTRCVLVPLLATTVLCSPALPAQAPRLPSDGGTTFSIGQPGAWQGTWGFSSGLERRHGEPLGVVEGRVGLYTELLSRVLGLGGAHVETYVSTMDTRTNAGVHGRIVSPFARVGFGFDYSGFDHQLRPLFSMTYPARRGGLFHDGSVVRIDYRPGPEKMLTVGVEGSFLRKIPLGTTRPYDDRVRMRLRPVPPAPLPGDRDALLAALTEARTSARRIQLLTVPWIDHKGGGGKRSDAAVLDHLQDVARGADGLSLDDETRRFHAAMERAFTLAMAPPGDSSRGAAIRGRAVAVQARAILLDEVLLPYDRLLGQSKDKDSIREFAVLARGAFLRWLHVQSGIPHAAVDAVLAVFVSLLDMVEENRAMAHAEWGASRFVWLPLQLALLPEEHDSQNELDAIVARAAGEPFTDGNDVSYVINEQFQYQLSRTIREARQYHVLWTHDFRGVDAQGDPDEMSYRHVLRSYYAAMIARVRAYDSTGVFPTYIIILDEFFYRQTKGRLWMRLLEDPLRHQVHLPSRFRSWEDSLRAAQDTLRQAIAASALLTAQRTQYGEAWLHNLVKVHVNITNSSDPTFWSWRIATAFPVPDTWMRDHRKLVFYDVTEDDLYRGEAIVTGAGVGEHYANLSWEDRSLLVRGPATLALKTAARELLIGQGVRADRIPAVLQPRPRALDYDWQVARAAARRTAVGDALPSASRPLRAALLQNRTGYDAKSINVTKAVLYTLMPAGSVIKIPDSLWNGTFWGSALTGCAMRGVRVLVIAPTLANAPARAFGSMIRSRELLWRLIMAERLLGPIIRRNGGLLKVGLYASEIPVSDVPGKILAVRTTLTQHAWLRDLFGFPPSVYSGLEELATTLGRLPVPVRSGREFEAEQRPLLHLKANFIASREAWTVMARSEWVAMTREFVPRRISQLEARSAAVASLEEMPDARIDIGSDVVQRWYDGLDPATRQRVVFYTMLGSANQNDRSMVSDGEAVIVLSGWPSVTATIDLISLIGQSKWVDDPAELDRYLPRHSDVATRIAHWFKFAF